MSVGRRPRSEGIGLESSGVEIDDRGWVVVDEYQQTSVPGVYAVGDLVKGPALAHVGFAEAIVSIKPILGEDVVPVDHDKVPWGIYCHPEVAFSGLTEAAAVERGYDVVTSVHRFVGNSRAVIMGETDGLVKIVAERDGPLLGVHIVGPVGDRAARRGLPRRELGGDRRRPRRADPSPSDPERAVRRVGARAHRSIAARLTRRTFRVDITMPQLGETVTEGTITRWLKQVGDTVALDEPLFEVSTDKVDSEVPAPAAGVLTEILVPEGDTVEVGARLAVLGDAGDRARAGAAAEAPAAAPAPAPEPDTRRPRRAPPPAPPRRRPRRRRHRLRAAPDAPAPALRRRLPPRPPAPAGGQRPGDVSGRAPPHRRARAGPGDDHRHRRRWPHHPARRVERVTVDPHRAGRADGLRTGHPRPPRPRHRVERAIRHGRRGRPVRQHPSAHRRAHGPVEADERARLHVGRGGLRARRARPARQPGGVEGARRASRSPTCRSSCARSATRCGTSRT